MKSAEEIVRALAAFDPQDDQHCLLCLNYIDELGKHTDDCPYRMAVEWVKENAAWCVRDALRKWGWVLRDDGYWSANETGSLDKRGPIWQDMLIDHDPKLSRQVIEAIQKARCIAAEVKPATDTP